MIGDILGPRNNMIADALALLRFGLQEGFLIDAAVGLVKTLVSDYRTVRGRLGLTAYAHGEVLDMLSGIGFEARILDRNIGHARHRRSVAARRVE